MATDVSSGTTGLGSSSVASDVVKASPLGHSRRRSRASKGRRHRHVRRFVVAPRSASPSPFGLSTNLTLRNPRRQQQQVATQQQYRTGVLRFVEASSRSRCCPMVASRRCASWRLSPVWSHAFLEMRPRRRGVSFGGRRRPVVEFSRSHLDSLNFFETRRQRQQMAESEQIISGLSDLRVTLNTLQTDVADSRVTLNTLQTDVAQLREPHNTAMSPTAKGDLALRNCTPTPFLRGEGDAVLLEKREATVAKGCSSEHALVDTVIPALQRAIDRASEDIYHTSSGDSGLMVVDSQDIPWLPQGNDNRKMDRKPDFFVLSKYLFEKGGGSGKSNTGKPALGYRFLHQVRSMGEGKLKDSNGSTAAGEASEYATDYTRESGKYAKRTNEAMPSWIHILCFDKERFSAQRWCGSTLMSRVEGSYDTPGSQLMLGRFLLGPSSDESQNSSTDRWCCPQEPRVPKMESLVRSLQANEAFSREYEIVDVTKPSDHTGVTSKGPLDGSALSAVLGRGATGLVLRGTRKAISRETDNKDVAVKIICPAEELRCMDSPALKEIEIYKFLKRSSEVPTATLVDEYQLKKKRFALVLTPVGLPFPGQSPSRKHVAAALSALLRLHSIGVVHNDARKENFITHDDRVLLIDFSASTRWKGTDLNLLCSKDHFDEQCCGDVGRFLASLRQARCNDLSRDWKTLISEASFNDPANLTKVVEENVKIANYDALVQVYFESLQPSYS